MTALARSIALLALLGIAGMAASGCGGTEIDHQKAADTLQHSLEGTFHEKIGNVDCPSGVEVDPGKTFTCTVDFPKEEAIATLKILNQDADLHIVGVKANK